VGHPPLLAAAPPAPAAPPATEAAAPVAEPAATAVAPAPIEPTIASSAMHSEPGTLAAGVSLGGAWSGGTLAPNLTADLVLEPWPDVPITVAALYTGAHEVPLGLGQAAWSRVGLGASVAYRFPFGGSWFTESGVALAATGLLMEGRDVPTPNHAVTLDPGTSLLLRLGHHGARTRWWLGATLSRWLRPQGAFVRGTSDQVDLARWELGVGVGFDVTSGRQPT